MLFLMNSFTMRNANIPASFVVLQLRTVEPLACVIVGLLNMHITVTLTFHYT